MSETSKFLFWTGTQTSTGELDQALVTWQGSDSAGCSLISAFESLVVTKQVPINTNLSARVRVCHSVCPPLSAVTSEGFGLFSS